MNASSGDFREVVDGLGDNQTHMGITNAVAVAGNWDLPINRQNRDNDGPYKIQHDNFNSNNQHNNNNNNITVDDDDAELEKKLPGLKPNTKRKPAPSIFIKPDQQTAARFQEELEAAMGSVSLSPTSRDSSPTRPMAPAAAVAPPSGPENETPCGIPDDFPVEFLDDAEYAYQLSQFGQGGAYDNQRNVYNYDDDNNNNNNNNNDDYTGSVFESNDGAQNDITQHQYVEEEYSNNAVNDNSSPPPQIEVGGGLWLPLRDTEQTKLAMAEGFLTGPLPCSACTLSINCIKDALYIICPACYSLTPLEAVGKQQDFAHGVGLGFIDNELSDDDDDDDEGTKE